MSPISGNCSPEWRQLVSCQADGELDEFDTARLNRHLADCSACLAWAAEVSSLTGLVRSAEPADPDRALTPQLLRRRRSRASFATASAASVAAAAVAAFALQLPTVVGLAGPGHENAKAADAAPCRWCVAHSAFLKPAFVEPPQPSILLNRVKSA